jgi:hypothetical protein
MELSEEPLWTLLRPPQGPLAPYVDVLARELLDDAGVGRSPSLPSRLDRAFLFVRSDAVRDPGSLRNQTKGSHQ